jgi:hypothetical protein
MNGWHIIYKKIGESEFEEAERLLRTKKDTGAELSQVYCFLTSLICKGRGDFVGYSTNLRRSLITDPTYYDGIRECIAQMPSNHSISKRFRSFYEVVTAQPDLLIRLAKYYIAQLDVKNTADVAKKIIALSPKLISQVFAMCPRRGAFCEQLFLRLHSISDESLEAQYYLAVSRLFHGKNDLGTEEFQRVIDADPDSYFGRRAIAMRSSLLHLRGARNSVRDDILGADSEFLTRTEGRLCLSILESDASERGMRRDLHAVYARMETVFAGQPLEKYTWSSGIKNILNSEDWKNKKSHRGVDPYFLFTQPKSGTMFMISTLGKFLGGTPIDASIGLGKEGIISEPRIQWAKENFAFLTGHVFPSDFNLEIIKRSNMKALVHCRDPISSSFSMLRMQKRLFEGNGFVFDPDWIRCGYEKSDERFDFRMMKIYLAQHVAWRNAWASCSIGHEDQIRIVHFEDMVTDIQGYFLDIESWLGINEGSFDGVEEWDRSVRTTDLLHFVEGNNDAWKNYFDDKEQRTLLGLASRKIFSQSDSKRQT